MCVPVPACTMDRKVTVHTNLDYDEVCYVVDTPVFAKTKESCEESCTQHSHAEEVTQVGPFCYMTTE